MADSPPTGSHDGPSPNSGELVEAVYEHLRAIARQRMKEEGPGHTLQATALVHEALIRIGQNRRVAFKSRAHFFATAAEAMRRILIDHARAKGALKRTKPETAQGDSGGEALSVMDLALHQSSEEILALDRAMERLDEVDPEAANVVRLRFFAGLTGDETAEALELSPRQVDRLWSFARAYLAREVDRREGA